MSSFNCYAVRITEITKHPDADRLSLVKIGGYTCVVQSDKIKEGDLRVYVPEAGVVPHELLKQYGFWDEEKDRGLLAGKDYNRVKAIRLRGILSQGILLAIPDLEAHEDYAEELGIVKYMPEIPKNMSGQLVSHPGGAFSYTDIENIKKFPDVFFSDEAVVMTEKLHGTCAIFHLDEDGFWVSSKGNASKGAALKDVKDEYDRSTNFYWRIAEKYNIEASLRKLLSVLNTGNFIDDIPLHTEITLFGEGLGVQDLKYGTTTTDVQARFFDLRVDGKYIPFDSTLYFLNMMELPPVPVLFKGFISEEALELHTNGKETLSGNELHVREGIVVQPMFPRFSDEIGRVILKSVSADYLTRKGDITEYE